MLVLLASAPPGPSWVQLLSAVGLGSVLSALVTAASLLYQGRRNADRETAQREHDARERQLDRDSERTRRNEERQSAMQDHWRDRRLDAATGFLDSAEGAMLLTLAKKITDGLQFIAGAEEATEQARTLWEAPETVQIEHDLRKHYYEVLLLGGDESRIIAFEVYQYIQDAQESSAPQSSDQAASMRQFQAILAKYRRCVRKELGTVT